MTPGKAGFSETRMVKTLMRLAGNRISTSLPIARASGFRRRIHRFGPLASEKESHSLCLGDFFLCERTTQHNTPKHEVREVRYRWHPLFGKSIIVHGQLVKRGCHLFRYLLPGQHDRIGFEIPAWMLDPARCAGMLLKVEPHVSWQALLSLQQLCKEALEPLGALRQSADKNSVRTAYAQDPTQTVSASESIRSDSQPTTMGGAGPKDRPTTPAAVAATIKQSCSSQARPRRERRGR